MARLSVRGATVLLWTLFVPDRLALATVLRVDAHAPGVGANGTTWPLAYRTLRDALAASGAGTEIWVADGSYFPDQGSGSIPDSRLSTFALSNNVQVFGGFSGYAAGSTPGVEETARAQRDFRRWNSQLDGTVAPGVFAYSVVTAPSGGPLLDGVTVVNGHADEPGSSCVHCRGGGILVQGGTPTLRNLTVMNNSATVAGGGLHASGGIPLVADSAFLSNNAGSGFGGGLSWVGGGTIVRSRFEQNGAAFGGGVFVSGPAATISQSTFVLNTAGDTGGGLYLSAPGTVVSCSFLGNGATSVAGGAYAAGTLDAANLVFASNTAGLRGGALGFAEGPPPTTVTSSTFTNNSAPDGGSAYLITATNVVFSNSIFWGNHNDAGRDVGGGIDVPATWLANVHVSSSLVQGGFSGGVGVLNVAPVFERAPAASDFGDLRLQAASPGIDAGDSARLPADASDLDGDTNTGESLPRDLAGLPRLIGSAVDMGAFEWIDPASCRISLRRLTFSEPTAASVDVVAYSGGDGATAIEVGRFNALRNVPLPLDRSTFSPFDTVAQLWTDGDLDLISLFWKNASGSAISGYGGGDTNIVALGSDLAGHVIYRSTFSLVDDGTGGTDVVVETCGTTLAPPAVVPAVPKVPLACLALALLAFGLRTARPRRRGPGTIR